MSICVKLYIILKLRISFRIHIWRLFGGFVMQGHICTCIYLQSLSSTELMVTEESRPWSGGKMKRKKGRKQ